MMDIAMNFNSATNGFWTIYDMTKLFHFFWYMGWSMFFVLTLINIHLINKVYGLKKS